VNSNEKVCSRMNYASSNSIIENGRGGGGGGGGGEGGGSRDKS
jgi:hypothetical protein